jgi:hypothetical protein
MARIIPHVIAGISGKLAGMIFRQRNGKTFVSMVPSNKPTKRSAKQQEVGDRFRRAVQYAKSAIANPVMRDIYKAKAPKGKSAYNMALADFLHAPVIQEVDVTGYSGKVGELIKLKVIDDFEVKSVNIKIHKKNGDLQEEGAAVRSSDQMEWAYVVKNSNRRLIGSKVTVIANDNPGNTTRQDKIL